MTYLLYVGQTCYEVRDTYLAVRQMAHDLWAGCGGKQTIEVRLSDERNDLAASVPLLVLLASPKKRRAA